MACRLGWVENKPDERGWRDRLVKCSIMVRLEPYKPLLSDFNSVEGGNFRG